MLLVHLIQCLPACKFRFALPILRFFSRDHALSATDLVPNGFAGSVIWIEHNWQSPKSLIFLILTCLVLALVNLLSLNVDYISYDRA